MGDAPIDVEVTRMVAWLVDRDRVPAEWQRALRTVRAELSSAMEAFPPAVLPELQRIAGKDYISYYHVCAIRDALAEAATREGRGGRNLIGQDRDPATYQWRKLTSAYERNGIYLAEAGRVLAQNVVYALPSGKVGLKTLEKYIESGDRKAAAEAKSAAGLQQTLEAACAELGLALADVAPAQPKGHLEAQLRSGLPALAEHLQLVRSAIRGEEVQRAARFYAESVARSAGGAAAPALLSTMALLAATEEAEFVVDDADAAALAAGGASFDGDGDDDVGFSIGGDGDDGVGFSFGGGGDDDDDDVGFSIGGDGDDGVGFSFGGGDDDDDDPFGTAAENAAGGGASGAAAASPSSLRNPAVRDGLMQDALELIAFLAQRRDEMNDTGNGAAERAILAASAGVGAGRAVSAEEVGEMLIAVQGIPTLLETKQVVHLLRLDSPVYVQRCAAGLRAQLKGVAKRKKTKAAIERQRGTNAAELKVALAKQQALVDATKALQKNVEASLSELYSGRTVRIVGAINAASFV